MQRLKQFRPLITRFSIGLVVVLLILLPFDGLAAQEQDDTITLQRTAAPNSLLVGENTIVTLNLLGSPIEQCILAYGTPADVVLVVDVSTSMDDHGKLDAAKAAASQFVTNTDLTSDQVAVVAFSTSASLVQPLTQDDSALQQALAGLSTIAGTTILNGLTRAADILTGPSHRPDASANIILLSDGQGDQQDVQQAEQITAQDIRIFTISLGNDAERDLMRSIASFEPYHYHAPSLTDLEAIYEAIRAQISDVVATDILVSTSFNAQAFELDPDALSPPALVNGNHITWTLPLLAASQAVTLDLGLRATQPGVYSATLSAGAVYTACGIQPRSFTLGPGPQLVVLSSAPETATPSPMPTPSQEEPASLGNDWAQSTACLGPFTWPCTTTNLPWWVCLLLLLLLLLALLFWWLWRRREQQEWTPPPWNAIIPPGSPPFPAPSALPAPKLLSPPALPTLAAQSTTLVIGLGETGRGALDSLVDALSETYGHPPANVRLLRVDVGQPENAPADDTLYLPLDETVHTLTDRLARGEADLSYLSTWYTPLESTSNPRDRTPDRALCRLALLAHDATVRRRLAAEIRALALEPGQRVQVYFISSLAGATASGLLVDLAHLVRLDAMAQELSVSIHSLILLPQAHSIGSDPLAQSDLHRAALASWRELDRFQLVFEHAYPITYTREQTHRQGRLFERCYLLGLERDSGPSLLDTPLEQGLYPVIADVLVALLDPALQTAWEEVYRSTDNRLSERQELRHQALYSSLGSLTYVLPIEDLVEKATLDMVEQLIVAQQVTSAYGPSVATQTWLEEASTNKSPNTSLIQTIAELAHLSPPKAGVRAGELGMDLASLWLPGGHEGQTKESLGSIQALAYDYLRSKVRTSYEMMAQDESQDTLVRLLPETDRAIARLDDVDEWLSGCVQVQGTVFERRLAVQLGEMLPFDASQSQVTGPGPARAFLAALVATLENVRATVESALEPRQVALNEYRALAAEARQDLIAAAQAAQDRQRPGLRRALGLGVGLPALAAVGMGALALLSGALFWPAAALALLGSLAGGVWAYRALFAHSSLIALQEAYREAEQERLAAEIEMRLYRAWVALLVNMNTTTQRSLAPLQAWQTSLQALEPDLERRRKALAARRQRRKHIRVRHYLEDSATETALRQRHLASDALDNALARLLWQPQADGAWWPSVYGTKIQSPDPGDPPSVRAALLDLAQAYTAHLRMARLARLLAELHTPAALSEQAGPGSDPLIRTHPNRQPDAESHRFVCLDATGHQAHFRAVVDALRKPAAVEHSQQLVEHTAYPHRCTILATLDLIHPPGLPAWDLARDAYLHLSSRERAALHLFPAETHASRWEGALTRLHLEARPFSPYTCLALEDEQRTRAFWRAYGHGWVVEREQLVGRTSLRCWALTLPNQEPLPLTKPREGQPSLWKALVGYVLLERGGPVEAIEMAATTQQGATPSARREAAETLERRIEKIEATLRPDPDPRGRELELLMRLALEDTMCRLYDEPPLLDWIPDPGQTLADD